MAIRTTFGHHIYLFQNKLFKQQKGGPIGLHLTGVVDRLVMDHWAKRFRSILETNRISVYLLKSM